MAAINGDERVLPGAWCCHGLGPIKGCNYSKPARHMARPARVDMVEPDTHYIMPYFEVLLLYFLSLLSFDHSIGILSNLYELNLLKKYL